MMGKVSMEDLELLQSTLNFHNAHRHRSGPRDYIAISISKYNMVIIFILMYFSSP